METVPDVVKPVTQSRLGGGLDPAGFPYAVHFNDRTSRNCTRPLWGMEASTGLVCGADTGDVTKAYCAACARVLWSVQQVRKALDPRLAAIPVRLTAVQFRRYGS